VIFSNATSPDRTECGGGVEEAMIPQDEEKQIESESVPDPFHAEEQPVRDTSEWLSDIPRITKMRSV